MRFSDHFATKATPSSLLAFVLSASLLPLAAQAATVTLSNGDRISGELLQLHDNTLTLRSGLFGEVKIPWAEVCTLTSDEDVSILLQDGTTVRGTVLLQEDGALAIQPEGGAPVQAVQRQSVTALNPPVIDASMKHSGKLDVGGSFNRGNSSDDQFSIIGEFIARSPEKRYTVGVVINEGRALGVTTTSNRHLLTQYDAFLNDRDFLFASARAESDDLAGLELRTSLGAGYGRQFYDSDITKLSGQVGVNYVRENYSIAPDQSFPTLSIGLKFDREFFNRRLVYFQYMNVDTSLNDTSDTLLRTRLGLRVPVSENVNVSTQLSHDYANQPPAGNKNSDTALIFSVGYGF